jgi:single-stranded-DNA-specific exonuclease
MLSAPKQWIVAPKVSPDFLRRYRGMSPVLAQILYNRGFTDSESAYQFLYAEDITSGALLTLKRARENAIDRALSRVRQAIARREIIVVYGDFDADGVTSTALLVQVLKSLGAEAYPYIPHRVDEGYGLNSDALLRLSRRGAKLIITVDCGIRSVQEVEDGKAYGLDIIITDHHSMGPEVPKAYAVINPKLDDCEYTEPMLAGVGVSYRLAEALLTIHSRSSPGGGANGANRIPTTDELLDLVAVGTVADLAPLNSPENRALVRRGLAMLNAGKRLGFNALVEVAGLKPGMIESETIGFGIGPRINAAGRLDSAMEAYKLLSTSEVAEAIELAQKLQILNTQRQELTKQAQEMIRARIEAQQETESPLIFASDASFIPGIVGLVAGRLTEEYFRPSIVMEEGETESRASCRSIPQFDITRALDQCAALLVRHGGHAQAAGFTVLNENIVELKEQLTDIARKSLDGQELRPTLSIDLELDANLITRDSAEELTKLEPTGHMNPTPVLITRNLRVMEVRNVGKEDKHLKIRFTRTGSAPIDGIGFNLGDMVAQFDAGEAVDVVYQLEINEWNGLRTAQLNIQDMRASGAGE